MKLAFVTDIHFGRQNDGAATALLHDLNTHRPDLILIGGDLTQRAYAAQYQAARDFIKQLPSAWLCVPGNHDVPAWNLWARFTAPFGLYQKYISHDVNPGFVNDQVAILGLNSARRWMRQWAWEQGGIANRQLKFTRDFFKNVPDSKLKILMVHHPVSHPVDHDTRMLVDNHAAAVKTFIDCGVDIILTGHLHRANIRDARSIMPQLKKPLLFIQGSTTLSDRTRGEDNNYWLLNITDDAITCRLQTLRNDVFTQTDVLTYARAANAALAPDFYINRV